MGQPSSRSEDLMSIPEQICRRNSSRSLFPGQAAREKQTGRNVLQGKEAKAVGMTGAEMETEMPEDPEVTAIQGAVYALTEDPGPTVL